MVGQGDAPITGHKIYLSSSTVVSDIKKCDLLRIGCVISTHVCCFHIQGVDEWHKLLGRGVKTIVPGQYGTLAILIDVPVFSLSKVK